MSRRDSHGEATLFDCLDKVYPADVRELGCGLPQSPDAGRPVDAGHTQHGPVLANSAQHGTVSGATTLSGAAQVVGGLCRASGHEGKDECIETSSWNMGVLGKAAHPHAGAVCPEETPGVDPVRLRVSHVVRILNSTPLGPVINERQLYRHRMKGGDRFYGGRRVDLLAYVAWLIEQRRLPPRRRRSETVSPEEVRQLLQRQNYRCALTGRHLTPDCASLDHVVPISRGGEHRIENAQVLHRDVNRAKGTLTNEEFLAICREVVAWTTSGKVREVRLEEREHA